MTAEVSNTNNFLLYSDDDGEVKVDVLLRDETIWLTINQMAELFGIDKSGISRHIKNIFQTGELQEELVVAKIATTTQHGAMVGKTQTKAVMYFNLDMIISVGYRVNSIRGTHFRIWATKQLKELIIKTGNTAAEVIAERSDASKDNMGLSTWAGVKVRKKDVTISKNYLTEDELDTLNRIVTMYLDYAELQAKNHRQMFMKDWREKLDAFLEFNGQEILDNAGSVSKEIADKLAEDTYDSYHQNRITSDAQRPSDIDEAVKKIK